MENSLDSQPPFLVEDWQHARSTFSGDGPARVFFVLKVSGPRGRWPLKAYIMGPGIEDEGACTPVEDEVDLEFSDEAFIELECEVDNPVPGQHVMRLYVSSTHVGDFPFQVKSDG